MLIFQAAKCCSAEDLAALECGASSQRVCEKQVKQLRKVTARIRSFTPNLSADQVHSLA
jgi:hypothetical protein